MKKSELGESYALIERDNKIIEILLSRIDMLNRLVDEKFDDLCIKETDKDESYKLKMEEEISILKEENASLREQKNVLEKSVEEKEMQIQNIKKEYFDSQKNFEEEIEDYKKDAERVKGIINLHDSYFQLNENIREELDGIIEGNKIENFVASVTCEDKLSRLYSKIKDVVIKNQSEVIARGDFSDEHKILADLFNFYYENILVIDKTVERKRLDVKVDTEYDSDKCIRIGVVNGTVQKVLLQGYKVNDEIKMRSIVISEE